jgi:hypothetical protein
MPGPHNEQTHTPAHKGTVYDFEQSNNAAMLLYLLLTITLIFFSLSSLPYLLYLLTYLLFLMT